MTVKLRIAWILSLILLLITGVMGIYNGITERSTGSTMLEKSVTAGVFLYGVLGLTAALGLFRRRRWSVPTTVLWAALITYVAAAAIIAYNEKDGLWLSVIIGGGVTALIAGGVVWTAREATRKNQSE